jgi:hypothetical protein
MNQSLYIFVEIGAGFAAIITFMFAFLAIIRRWILKRIYHDIELHLAKRGDSAEGFTDQARGEAERARHAAKQARHAADDARDAAYQATQAVQAARDHIRAVKGHRHDDTRSGSPPGNRQDRKNPQAGGPAPSRNRQPHRGGAGH